MNIISLRPMSGPLAHRFYQGFVPDPDLYQDKSQWKPFVYSEKFVEEWISRYSALGRIYLAIMIDDRPIGEIVLKEINFDKKCCTMGITMQNDSVKNQGFGTAAERLVLRYAFEEMGMQTVYADSLIGNLRSRHVLQKVGFVEIGQDSQFVYFQCSKPVSGAAVT